MTQLLIVHISGVCGLNSSGLGYAQSSLQAEAMGLLSVIQNVFSRFQIYHLLKFQKKSIISFELLLHEFGSNAIQQDYFFEISSLVHDIGGWVWRIGSVRFTHTEREANVVAHSLAKIFLLMLFSFLVLFLSNMYFQVLGN